MLHNGRMTQESIDELFTLAPAVVAAEAASLRAAADTLVTDGDAVARRRASAMRARATVLSMRGDLATPIESRVTPATRTAHRHRSAAEFTMITNAQKGVLAVMRYLENETGLTARWSGALGLSHPSDAGAMGFDGELRIARQYLEPIARLGAAAAVAARPEPVRSRRAQLTSREAGTVLLHEAIHAISPLSAKDYIKAPGAEEAIAEITMSFLYRDMMRAAFGVTVAEAEPLDYPKFREPLERIANTLGVTRTDAAERAFYFGFLRRRSLAGRLGYLRRALVLSGVAAPRAERLVNDCLLAWTGTGGDADRTATQRPPRRVTKGASTIADVATVAA